jgi:hypothetical protein
MHGRPAPPASGCPTASGLRLLACLSASERGLLVAKPRVLGTRTSGLDLRCPRRSRGAETSESAHCGTPSQAGRPERYQWTDPRVISAATQPEVGPQLAAVPTQDSTRLFALRTAREIASIKAGGARNYLCNNNNNNASLSRERPGYHLRRGK